MNNRELKKLLADSFQLENELYDFCIECLNKIYGEKASYALNEFNESLDFREYNGCIQSLSCIDNRFKKSQAEIKERENA